MRGFPVLLARFVCRRRKHEPPVLQVDMRPFEPCRFPSAASGKGNQSNSIGYRRSDAELHLHAIERLK